MKEAVYSNMVVAYVAPIVGAIEPPNANVYLFIEEKGLGHSLIKVNNYNYRFLRCNTISYPL